MEEIRNLIEKYEKDLIVLRKYKNELGDYSASYHEYIGEIDKLKEVIKDLKNIINHAK